MGRGAALFAKRNTRNLEMAIAAVKSGNPYRSVSKTYKLSYVTMFRCANGSVRKNGSRLALQAMEEEIIVRFLLKFTQRGLCSINPGRVGGLAIVRVRPVRREKTPNTHTPEETRAVVAW